MKAVFSVVFLLLAWPAAGQSDSAGVARNRIRPVVAVTAVGYFGSMAALNEVWYAQYPRQSFRFFNDGPEWKQIDKVGHFYSTFHVSRTAAQALRWAHVTPEKAVLWSSVAAFAMISSIEVFDGFSAGYGASASDLAANCLGASFFFFQQSRWSEVRIHPKFSFHRTPLARLRPELLGNGLHEELLKDYNGQTYWLSFDMNKFTRFPAWLNICVGYGAEDMIRGRPQPADSFSPYRQYYLGLDFDLTGIRTRSKWVKSLLFVANLIRLPAPAIAFSRRNTKVHLLYF